MRFRNFQNFQKYPETDQKRKYEFLISEIFQKKTFQIYI